MRAWFFDVKKLNILQIYGGFKGKRGEDVRSTNVAEPRMYKHECGSATNVAKATNVSN